MQHRKRTPLRELKGNAEFIVHQQLALPLDQAGSCRSIIHELHARQITLETQNEKLRSSQDNLMHACGNYMDLFNHAPIGYLVLDRGGFICEVNRTFAYKTGKEVGRLAGKPFADLLTDASRHNFRNRFKTFFNQPENRRLDLHLKTADASEWRVVLFGNRERGAADMPGEAPPRHGRIRIVCIDWDDSVPANKVSINTDNSFFLYHEVMDLIAKNDGEKMFVKVLNRLLDHFKSQYGFFGYIDEMENLVCPSMTRGVLPQCQVENKSIVFTKPEWKGLWGESLAGKKAIRKNSGLNLPAGHISLGNALAVPLLNHETLVGQIVLAEKEGGYGLEDEQMLTFIASWIAPVLAARLERNRYYEQRIKAENDLRQAQRMESIGVLTGGIAHDFNNILSPIIGYADMLLDETRDSIDVQRQLMEIYNAAKRARHLVGQLLAFSRKQMAVFKSLDINLCIENISAMLCRLIREDIAVSYDLDAKVKSVKADPGQIDQILLNLAVNAQDAMPQGGTLTIATRLRHLDADFEANRLRIDPGTYVEISVSDTGTGIPTDVLPLIFDPFFTTKDKGKGTGMGLATCYDIVKQHKGCIWADSRLAEGSNVCVLLPVTSCEAGSMAEPVPDASAVARACGETILVVEDEPAVRRIAVLSLKRLGYQVIDVDSPEACIALTNGEGASFDLLLSDIIMPGGNGTNLYLTLKNKIPNLKVLFMSGYTDAVVSKKGRLEDGCHFIGKPFTLEELSHKVREALEE